MDKTLLVSRIKSQRKLQNVDRFAGHFLVRRQNDSEHCYFTGLLFMHLAVHYNVDVTQEEISFVFSHDVLEVYTGDLLYPVKNCSKETARKWEEIEDEVTRTQFPWLMPFTDGHAKQGFTADAWELFRVCDMLELLLFLDEETERGNKHSDIWKMLEFAQEWLTLKDRFFPGLWELVLELCGHVELCGHES